jgi:hypothetical protein
MSTIYEDAKAALETLGFDVYSANDLSEDEVLPESYIVYQIISSPTVTSADNKPIGKTPRVQVAGWSMSGSAANAFETSIDAAMIAAGFSRIGGAERKDGNYYGWQGDYTKYKTI